MTETSQHGLHLEAEQLAAFAEGVLPEHERLQVLRHTADCVRCREIIFLAQEPVTVETPLPERTRWWRMWGQPWLLGGTAAILASLLLLSVFLWTQPAPIKKNAALLASRRTQDPIAPTPPAASARATQPKVRTEGEARAVPSPSMVPAQQERSAAVASVPVQSAYQSTRIAPREVALANAAPVPPAESVAGLAKRQRDTSAAPASPPSAQASPVANADAAPPVLDGQAAATLHAQRMKNLPLSGRNTNALRDVGLRAVAGGPVHLQIEHGAGGEGGKARLTGQVLDQSGAVVPRAVVRLTQGSFAAAKTQTAAQTSLEAVTDSAGGFSLPAVPVGQYQAQITAPGFVTVTQPVNFESRDVARLETVLPVGAASQAVEVSAANVQVETAEAKISRGLPEKPNKDTLPSGLATVTTVHAGEHSVALDSAGTVFVRREGKRWKRVKAPWPGVATKLEPAVNVVTMDALADQKKASSLGFQVTTAAGTVWISADGAHWTQR